MWYIQQQRDNTTKDDKITRDNTTKDDKITKEITQQKMIK